MSCAQWEERVALYAGGDLGREDAAEVAAHLGACPDCRLLARALEGDRREIEGLAGASEPSAADLAAVRLQVFERIERRRRLWRGLAWALAPALAGLLVFALLAPVGKRVERPRAPSPPQVALGPRVVPERIAEPPRPVRRRVRRKAQPPAPVPVPESEPLVVRFLTDDPNVVIVWLFDGKKGD